MCLRRESLSVHSHTRFQASSRFKCLPSVDRFQLVVGRRVFARAQNVVSLCSPRTAFFETRRRPNASLMPVPDTYSSLYETFMVPPGEFVCWTERVVSPATRTTLRSPSSP